MRSDVRSWTARALGLVIAWLGYQSTRSDLWPPLVAEVGFSAAVTVLAASAFALAGLAAFVTRGQVRVLFGTATVLAAVAFATSFPSSLGWIMVTVVSSGLQGVVAMVAVVWSFRSRNP
jgi:hypothetical protein